MGFIAFIFMQDITVYGIYEKTHERNNQLIEKEQRICIKKKNFPAFLYVDPKELRLIQNL